MPLVNMSDMLQHAYRHSYAVGAFGVASWDILESVVEAAEDLRAPVILSLSKSYPGTENIESLALAVVSMAQHAAIPVAFQIEVADDPQAIVTAIKLGCGGVVFDASQHPLMENIALTKKAVKLADEHGVMVVGHLANLDNGEATESVAGKTTSPIEAKHFVERTGVACLAVSVSRMEQGNAKHDFSRLAKINQMIALPLGIHGGSGLSDDQFRRMIISGASKINYSTPLFDAVARRIREHGRTSDTDYAGMVAQMREAIRLEVEQRIRAWGCGGRAAETLLQCRAWAPDGAHISVVTGSEPASSTDQNASQFSGGQTRASPVRRAK